MCVCVFEFLGLTHSPLLLPLWSFPLLLSVSLRNGALKINTNQVGAPSRVSTYFFVCTPFRRFASSSVLRSFRPFNTQNIPDAPCVAHSPRPSETSSWTRNRGNFASVAPSISLLLFLTVFFRSWTFAGLFFVFVSIALSPKAPPVCAGVLLLFASSRDSKAEINQMIIIIRSSSPPSSPCIPSLLTDTSLTAPRILPDPTDWFRDISQNLRRAG